jgi:O-antigen/teichoic acid export membrane protein
VLRSGRWLNTGALIVFQVLGLFIPLLTLPWLSGALGVGGFGQVMFAQAIMLLAVLWVDAGFNVQSQRLATLDLELERRLPQALLDNLIARSLAALLALCVLACLPLLLADLSFSLLAASLPLLLGTLLFPQWWLLATGQGLAMGLATVLGRLISALMVLALVRQPDDLVLAAWAISVGSMLSGLLVAKLWFAPLWRARHTLSGRRWWAYAQSIKATVLPAFLANACSQLPTVVLGACAGALQTGLFSAADRLTRAGAHLFSVVDQSLFTQWLQPLAAKAQSLARMRRRILILLPTSMALALGVAWCLAPWVIELLYGQRFAQATEILRILLCWLWLQSVRRLLVSMFWLLPGHVLLQARIQWTEVTLYGVLAAVLVGGVAMAGLQSWGLWAALGLCGIEVLLLLFFCMFNPRPKALKALKPQQNNHRKGGE